MQTFANSWKKHGTWMNTMNMIGRCSLNINCHITMSYESYYDILIYISIWLNIHIYIYIIIYIHIQYILCHLIFCHLFCCRMNSFKVQAAGRAGAEGESAADSVAQALLEISQCPVGSRHFLRYTMNLITSYHYVLLCITTIPLCVIFYGVPLSINLILFYSILLYIICYIIL